MPPRSKIPPLPKSRATKTGETLNDKRDEWRRIIKTNPTRAVAVLRIGPDHPETQWGDNMMDTYPAMLQIMETARGDLPVGAQGLQFPPASKEWQALVRAGVVEALCSWILNVRIHPDTPKEQMAPHSAFHWPLEALVNACAHIQRPPNLADKHLLNVIKENWSPIVQRIWDDPEQSLMNDDDHAVERVVVAQLAGTCLQQDPMILTVIFKPEDMTIPVIARHWSHSTSVMDTGITGQVLGILCNAQHPLHTAYATRYQPPEPTALLDRAYVGMGPFESSDRATQASSLITTFSSHFSRLALDDLGIEMDLFLGLLRASLKQEPDEFSPNLLSSSHFWKGALAIVKKPQPAHPPANPRGPPPALAVVNVALDVIHNAQVAKNHAAMQNLVRIWLDMGFFNALDNAVGYIVQYKGVTMRLSHMFHVIGQAMRDAPPGLQKLFGSQFPRWKLLGELISNDIKRQHDDEEKLKPPPPEEKQLPPDSQKWDQLVWLSFVDLWKSYVDWSACGRRACGKPGNTPCGSCKEVVYCSEGCQKKDAKDHKFSCPYITIIKGVTSGQPPVQAETREGEPAWSIVGDLAQAQPMSADAGGALDDLS